MLAKIERLSSLRRMAFLALAAVLTGLTFVPSLGACGCVPGATRTVYTSIVCCYEPPNPPSRPAEDQTCCNCQWQTTRSYCAPADVCAF
jgi:hypothetical protein